jgi:very-short-patch-repair endonuclease
MGGMIARCDVPTDDAEPQTNPESRFAQLFKQWREERAAFEKAEWGNAVPWEQPNSGRAAICFAFARSAATAFDIELDLALKETESPIEIMMLLALSYQAAYDQCDSISFIRKPSRHDFDTHLLLQPQAVLGDYRVDFMLELRKFCLATKREKGAWAEITSSLIVECDGHEFHEKTREQAARDKHRDRRLQSMGFPVFRFTGSEIWNNCLGCAEQAWRKLSHSFTSRHLDHLRAIRIQPEQVGDD